MIVLGATLDDHVQRRRPARRRSTRRLGRMPTRLRRCCGCRWRTRCGTASAPASRSRCSRSSSSRSSSARPRPGRSCTPSTTSTTFGGGFDVRATTSPAARSSTCAAALARVPGLDAGRLHVVSSQSSLPVKARQLGTSGEAKSRTSCTAPTARSSSTRPTGSRHGAGLRLGGGGLARAARRSPNLAVVDSARRAAQGELELRRRRRSSSCSGFYLEDKTFAPSRSTCATRRPAGSCA